LFMGGRRRVDDYGCDWQWQSNARFCASSLTLQLPLVVATHSATRFTTLFRAPGGGLQQGIELDTPLVHFLRFLLLTLERDAAPLFTLLRTRYASASVGRDPSLSALLDRIGERFYSIAAPKNLLSSMMDGLFGGA
jgi:hypothetical protein